VGVNACGTELKREKREEPKTSGPSFFSVFFFDLRRPACWIGCRVYRNIISLSEKQDNINM
jgi:hypothetical protein